MNSALMRSAVWTGPMIWDLTTVLNPSSLYPRHFSHQSLLCVCVRARVRMCGMLKFVWKAIRFMSREERGCSGN